MLAMGYDLFLLAENSFRIDESLAEYLRGISGMMAHASDSVSATSDAMSPPVPPYRR